MVAEVVRVQQKGCDNERFAIWSTLEEVYVERATTVTIFFVVVPFLGFTIDVQRAYLWVSHEDARRWITRNRFTPFEERPLRVVVMP